MHVTERLARFALDLRLEELPSRVVDQARLRVLDSLAVSIAGSQADCTRIALDVAREMGGRPAATVIGHGDRTSAPLVAFVNGMAAHALEFDDLTSSAVIHISPSVVPAMLALGESLGIDGKRYLESYIAGFELSIRITWGMMGPHLLSRGWHPNGVIAVIGCAAAGSRLLGCDLEQTRAAMGTAASASSGIRKNVGTMTKPFHMAHAARNGVLAAMLARRGFTADLEVLEQASSVLSQQLGTPDRGHDFFSFPETYAGPGGYDFDAMLRGLGEVYELATDSTITRFHPGSTFPQPAIDETIELVTRHDVRPEEVERVDVGVTPMCIAIACHSRPADGLKARFSVTYSIAVSVLDRHAGLRQYTDERVLRPDVQAFLDRVHVYVPDDFKELTGGWSGGPYTPASARVLIRLKDGRELRGERNTTKGFPGYPTTWNHVVEKYEECTESILTPDQVRRSIEMVGEIEKLSDIRRLVAELVTP